MGVWYNVLESWYELISAVSDKKELKNIHKFGVDPLIRDVGISVAGY